MSEKNTKTTTLEDSGYTDQIGLSTAAQKATDPAVMDAIKQIQAIIFSIIPEASSSDFQRIQKIVKDCQGYVGPAPSFDDGLEQIIQICLALVPKTDGTDQNVFLEILGESQNMKDH